MEHRSLRILYLRPERAVFLDHLPVVQLTHTAPSLGNDLSGVAALVDDIVRRRGELNLTLALAVVIVIFCVSSVRRFSFRFPRRALRTTPVARRSSAASAKARGWRGRLFQATHEHRPVGINPPS